MVSCQTATDLLALCRRLVTRSDLDRKGELLTAGTVKAQCGRPAYRLSRLQPRSELVSYPSEYLTRAGLGYRQRSAEAARRGDRICSSMYAHEPGS
jgi:hypothetical protein